VLIALGVALAVATSSATAHAQERLLRLPASEDPVPVAAPASPPAPAPAPSPEAPVQEVEEPFFPFRGQDVGVGYVYFTGSPGTGLGASGMARGLGVEFGTYRGSPWFDLMGKVRFLRASGTTLVEGVSTETDFTLVSGEAVIGARMHLLPGEFEWFAPYVGAAGLLGFQFLRLADVAPGGTVDPATTGMAMGTQFFTGVRLSRRAFAEIQMRAMTTNLANLKMLPLGGLGLVFGLSW